MNNAAMLEWNDWISALLWWVLLLHHRQRPWTLTTSYLPQITEKKYCSLLVWCSSLFLTSGSLGIWGVGGGGWPVNHNSEMVSLPNQAETVTVTFYLFCSDLMQARLNSLLPRLLLPAFLKKSFISQITTGSNWQQHPFKTPYFLLILFF